MSRISVIVPVYNAASSVSETLESLLSQTFTDLEIICIDDGSSDNSLEVLRDFAKRHDSICVLHQENQGVSVARNAGIDCATGDILMFADADDRFIPHACERVVEVFERTKAEVFTFGFTCEPECAMPLGMRRELKPPAKSYEHFEPSLLFEDKSRPYICRTAVSRAFVEREHIRFEPGIALGEDQAIYFLLYPLARGVELSPEQLYVYTMNPNSATHQNAHSENGTLVRLSQHLAVIETILKYWKDRNFADLCPNELLDWILDFVLYDINGLSALSDRQSLFKRLIDDLTDFFERQPSGVSKHFATRRCLKQAEMIAECTPRHGSNARIGILDLSLFYYQRYGLIRCAQQVLIGLGVLKKWR